MSVDMAKPDNIPHTLVNLFCVSELRLTFGTEEVEGAPVELPNRPALLRNGTVGSSFNTTDIKYNELRGDTN